MKHRASPRFWSCYASLPVDVQDQADRAYGQLKTDPRLPTLHRVSIGTHAQYDQLLKKG